MAIAFSRAGRREVDELLVEIASPAKKRRDRNDGIKGLSRATLKGDSPIQPENNALGQSPFPDTLKRMVHGGGGRIRTHGGIAPTTVFKTAAFNRSATPPIFRKKTRSFFLNSKAFVSKMDYDCCRQIHFEIQFSISPSPCPLPLRGRGKK